MCWSYSKCGGDLGFGSLLIRTLFHYFRSEIQKYRDFTVLWSKKCLAIVIPIARSPKNHAVGKQSNRLMILRIMCAAPSVITIILHSNVFVKPLIVFLSYSESNRTTHLAHPSSLTTIISYFKRNPQKNTRPTNATQRSVNLSFNFPTA